MQQLTEVGFKSNISYYDHLIESKKAEILQLETQRSNLIAALLLEQNKNLGKII